MAAILCAPTLVRFCGKSKNSNCLCQTVQKKSAYMCALHSYALSEFLPKPGSLWQKLDFIRKKLEFSIFQLEFLSVGALSTIKAFNLL